MRALQGAGTILAGILVFVAFVFLVALYIAGLAWVSKNVLGYLLIAATIAFAVCVFVLLPCALFRATRKFSAYGLFISSVIFGASTWILGFLLTLQYWGVFGVFVGVIMGVVGIVPLGMLASAFHSDWSAVGQLALGLVLTFGARMAAVMVAARMDRDEAGINSNSWAVAGVIAVSALSGVVALSVLDGASKNTSNSGITNRPTILSTDDVYRIADANAAVGRGDYATALRLVRPLAEQGNALAEVLLGSMYESGGGDQTYMGYADGHGVPQNYAEAMKWYRKAAEQGNAAAQGNLGVMYEKGHGVPQNYAEAMKWYRKAADQGNAYAQVILGARYAEGQGIPQNFTEAMKWYRLAADQGDAYAQFNLGVMYADGQGVPQNFTEAMKWYRKAADQGSAAAQFNLGVMYADGQGVPQDYVNAHMWFNLAAAQGDQDALKNRELVEQRMTPAQIAEAQKLAREWQRGQLSASATSVPMREVGGIYVVPVLINDAITLNFIVDSGAADVSIPADVVMTLVRAGTLAKSDFLGEKTYVLADGSTVPSQTFRIRSLKVGGKVVENVTGSIASEKSNPLVGQSFLGRFKSWSVDNAKHALIFE
jgi:TPR repeat protein